MGNTRDTGFLRNVIFYDADGNIGLHGAAVSGYALYLHTSINDGSFGIDSTGNINALYLLKNGTKEFEISYDSATTKIFRLLPYQSNSFFEIGNPSNAGADYIFVSEGVYGNVLIGPGIGNATGNLTGATALTHKIQLHGAVFADSTIQAASFIITGGAGTGFLKADGTVDSTTYITSSALTSYATQAYVGTQIANLVASAGGASYATYLPTAYAGGVQGNPQVYFNNGIGLKVAMTGAWSTWSDTIWVNGYSGGDVPWMCALHFLRNSQPRMAISAQTHGSGSYGSYYEVITTWNIGSQSVSYASSAGSASNITAYTINQSVGTGNSPTFANVYASDWFRCYGSSGLYNQSYNNHFYSSGGTTWNFATNGGSYIQIALRPSGHESTVRGYLYADTSNNVGLLSYDGNWALRMDSSRNAIVSGGVFPSNQTSYYLYQANSGLWTNGNFGANGDIYLGTRGNWLSTYLNQNVRTDSNPTFNDVNSNGYIYAQNQQWGNGTTQYHGTNTAYNWRDWGGWGGYWWSRNGGDMIMNLYALYAVTGGISDIRYKKDIEVLPYGLKEVMQLNPIKFHYNLPKESMLANDPDYFLGFSAQEMQGIIPEAVHEKIAEDNDSMKGMLAITYDELVPVLVNAIKEQQTQIEDLKKQIIYLVENK